MFYIRSIYTRMISVDILYHASIFFHSNNIFIKHDLYIAFPKFMNKGISDFFLYNNELNCNERKSQKNAKERQWTKKTLNDSE